MTNFPTFRSCVLCPVCIFAISSQPALADRVGWSVVSYTGLSLLEDQSPSFAATDTITDGRAQASVSTGFAAGLGIRYDYQDSPWSSEIGWEYRSNDTRITTVDGNSLPAGNYASNIFYLNRRYALTDDRPLTPWLGGGITWVQEIDLDSEASANERSFSDSGSVGFQLMAGLDYQWTDQFYVTGELRYSNLTDLRLSEEGGNGEVSGLNYQPLTLGVGIGYRF